MLGNVVCDCAPCSYIQASKLELTVRQVLGFHVKILDQTWGVAVQQARHHLREGHGVRELAVHKGQL